MADASELEGFDARIDRLVSEGRYASRAEVLADAMRLVEERDAVWTRFEAEIQKGIDDVDAGRVENAEVVFARLKKKYRDMATKSAA